MKLTIAIPTYRRYEPLILTLRQLLAVRHADEEVLVLDQNEMLPDAIEAVLAGWEDDGEIRRIRLSAPSLTAARNIALLSAVGDIVLFVDDDVMLPRETIDKHLCHYEEDSEISAVTGQVFQCQDRMSYPPEWATWRAASDLHFHAGPSCTTDTVIGCNHSVKKMAVFRIGGYDESFIASAHGEDFDIGHRLTLGGFKVRYDPEAWLIHFKARSGGCRVVAPGKVTEWTNTANLFLYTFRHAHRKKCFVKYYYLALRAGPLRRKIIVRPWLWPQAWFHCVKGMQYGRQHRKFTPSDRMVAVNEDGYQ